MPNIGDTNQPPRMADVPSFGRDTNFIGQMNRDLWTPTPTKKERLCRGTVADPVRRIDRLAMARQH